MPRGRDHTLHQTLNSRNQSVNFPTFIVSRISSVSVISGNARESIPRPTTPQHGHAYSERVRRTEKGFHQFNWPAPIFTHILQRQATRRCTNARVAPFIGSRIIVEPVKRRKTQIETALGETGNHDKRIFERRKTTEVEPSLCRLLPR